MGRNMDHRKIMHALICQSKQGVTETAPHANHSLLYVPQKEIPGCRLRPLSAVAHRPAVCPDSVHLFNMYYSFAPNKETSLLCTSV